MFPGLRGLTFQNLDPERWESEVAAYEKSDSVNFPAKGGIVFTGSSSIRLWKNLPQQFPGKKVINRGIGGSQLSDIIYYADRLIKPYQPRKVFVYCGGNDIQDGKSPEKVLEDFKALYNRIKKNLPDTKLYYISIQTAPVREKNDAVFQRANELIKAYLLRNTPDVYIDVTKLLQDEKGHPKPEYFIEDQLHMNDKGYERWARVIKPYVEQ